MTGQVPVLTPEQTVELLQHNHMLHQQLQSQINLTLIVAYMALREAKYIEQNVLIAAGHSSLSIKNPLVLSVTQDELNALGEIFPGDRPVLGFRQDPATGALTFQMLPQSYAENDVSVADAARPN